MRICALHALQSMRVSTLKLDCWVEAVILHFAAIFAVMELWSMSVYTSFAVELWRCGIVTGKSQATFLCVQYFFL